MRQRFDQAIVFTGHRIDPAGRAESRFPSSAEAQARKAIRAAVDDLRVRFDAGRLVGIAGGASGGDLLFHEVCAELGIQTRLVLALPPEAFLAASVIGAGEDWVLRFRRVQARLGTSEVSVIAQHPAAGDAIWADANRSMIELAVSLSPNRALLALWDGKGGDGPGGTAAMVRMAKLCGVKRVVTISMKTVVERAEK